MVQCAYIGHVGPNNLEVEQFPARRDRLDMRSDICIICTAQLEDQDIPGDPPREIVEAAARRNRGDRVAEEEETHAV